MKYTSRNNRFETDTGRGHEHRPREARGSVTQKPIVDDPNGYSLWLEYVKDKKYNNNTMWLMWYDSKGNPTINVSGVFGKDALSEMIKALGDAVKDLEQPPHPSN